MNQQLLDTPVGRARLDYFHTQFPTHAHRATLVLGHGTATGVEAADLQALAAALPAHGFSVVLVTQPYRVEGNPRVADPASLDRAWTAVWAHLAATTPPGPIVAGDAAPDRRWPAAPLRNSTPPPSSCSPIRCAVRAVQPN
jgi:hypothetical protein